MLSLTLIFRQYYCIQRNTQTAKNLFGHVAYLVSGIKDIANIQPHHAAFDLPDGTHIEGDYIFGAVTNTTSAGGVIIMM